MKTISSISRRDFLRTGGAVVVSFALGASLPKLVLIAAPQATLALEDQSESVAEEPEAPAPKATKGKK